MKWIEFIYMKDDQEGQPPKRTGFEVGESHHGHRLIYQVLPKAGWRTFVPTRMFEEKEIVSPWQTETYARRMRRMARPLFTETEKWILWVGYVLIGAGVLNLLVNG